MSTTSSFPSIKPWLSLPGVLRVLVVATAFGTSVAYADDYADVNRLLHAGQYAEALGKADQYLTGKPRDPQMRFLKGVIQTESGKAAEAIGTFAKITEEYPELPEPYNNLAVLYAGQSQFEKARVALEMAIRTNPSYATAHENLGDVYARLASQAYSKALQLDGASTTVQSKLALIRTLFSTDSKNPSKPIAASRASPALAIAPATSSSDDDAEKQVEAAVRAWADAWSNKNMEAYLASYNKNFRPPENQTSKAWEADLRVRIVGKSPMSTKLSNFSVAVHGSKATAKFKQDYSADPLNISNHKTLDLDKVGDRWTIVRESTGT